MTTSPPGPTLDTPRPRASHVKQILITLVCGVLLAVGSCFGFVNTLNFNGPAKPGNTLFGIGFFVGAALVVSAGIWALLAILMFFIRAARGEQ